MLIFFFKNSLLFLYIKDIIVKKYYLKQMKGICLILFLCLFQMFFCFNRANEILKEIFPFFKNAVSNILVKEDIIVKNKRFVITNLDFSNVEFEFYNNNYISFNIPGINSYYNFDVYPNPGNRDIHGNYFIYNKSFNFRGRLQFIRDNSYTNDYRPLWTDYQMGFDLEPISIDENMLFVEYVKEDYYEMNGYVYKKVTDEWEITMFNLLSRLYKEGMIN